MIPLSKPILGREEERAVLEVLRSGKLSQGQKVEEFEKKFAKFIGSKYAVATSSGTTALHLCLLVLNIGPGDEVITTPFSFIASANVILYVGARPIFVDINPQTFNLNPRLIEKAITPKTKAILPVHLFGLPADMEKILYIAKEYKLFVIEDACQSHDAEVKMGAVWKKVGSIGDVGCFSFYPTKNMTTAEGGMVVTNKKEIAQKIKMLRNHGMRVRYQYEQLGYNFRMTEIQAAIGIEQLKKIAKFTHKRIQNAKILSKLLYGVQIPYVSDNTKHVFHQFTIKVPSTLRDKLSNELNKKGIATGIYYPKIITKYNIYRKHNSKNLFQAEKACKEVLSIPIHPQLSNSDLMKIAKIINTFIKNNS